jgi:hypothetical protein
MFVAILDFILFINVFSKLKCLNIGNKIMLIKSL